MPADIEDARPTSTPNDEGIRRPWWTFYDTVELITPEFTGGPLKQVVKELRSVDGVAPSRHASPAPKATLSARRCRAVVAMARGAFLGSGKRPADQNGCNRDDPFPRCFLPGKDSPQPPGNLRQIAQSKILKTNMPRLRTQNIPNYAVGSAPTRIRHVMHGPQTLYSSAFAVRSPKRSRL